MDDIESIYLQENFNQNRQSNEAMDRLKIGEVFQVRQSQFVFVCIHCSMEYQHFGQFTAHVQEHFQNAMHWLAPSEEKQERDVDSPIDAPVIEWLFSDSTNSDDCEMAKSTDDFENEANDVNIDDDPDMPPHNIPFEQDEYQSLESRFKLKNPLVRVKDTPETRKFLPYFAKRYLFKRIDQRFQCPMCDYMSCSRSAVREHLFVHSEIKIFSCKLCDREFNRPRNLRDHIEQRHSGVSITPTKPLKRLKIERDFDESHSAVTDQMNVIQPKYCNKMSFSLDNNRSECLICKKTFSRPNGIMKHMKVHTQERNYQCTQCGAQFGRSDHLSRHMLIHDKPKHKCDVCNTLFRRSDKLLIHRRRHAETMNYTCEQCGLGFMDLASIKTHINFHCKMKVPNVDIIEPIPQSSSQMKTE